MRRTVRKCPHGCLKSVPLSRSATALSGLPVEFREGAALRPPGAASVGHLPFWTQDPSEQTGLPQGETLSPQGARADDGCSRQVCPAQGPLQSGEGGGDQARTQGKGRVFYRKNLDKLRGERGVQGWLRTMGRCGFSTELSPVHACARGHWAASPPLPAPARSHRSDSPEQWLGCCKHTSFICLP